MSSLGSHGLTYTAEIRDRISSQKLVTTFEFGFDKFNFLVENYFLCGKIFKVCMTILWTLGVVRLMYWNFAGQSGLCKSFIFYQMTVNYLVLFFLIF